MAWGQGTLMSINKNLDDSFYRLDPESILGAFERAGLEVECTVTFLNSLENRVVRVQNAQGERWVGKFYRPLRWSKQALLEEHQFLSELQQEGLPVVCPLSWPGGSGKYTTLGTIQDIYFAVFPFQQGRSPDELTPALAYQIGALIGRLHQVGIKGGGRFRHRPMVGPSYWARQALDILEQEAVVPGQLWPQYRDTVLKLISVVEGLFSGRQCLRIHGDLHRGNVLISSQGPVLVDLDDCATGPAVCDIWLLAGGRDNESIELRELMLEGYQSVRPFDRSELALIEPLRALKFVHYAAWLTRRRKDPAFARLFPATESYGFWRQELEELVAQLERLKEFP